MPLVDGVNEFGGEELEISAFQFGDNPLTGVGIEIEWRVFFSEEVHLFFVIADKESLVGN